MRPLQITLAVAIALRLVLLCCAEYRPEKFDFPDSHRYLAVARHIAAGDGPIDSPRVRAGTDPLYPMLLALGVRLGVDSDAALMRFGRVVNVLAALISVALVAAIARRFIGPRAAIIAAGLLAIDPILLFFNALVLTETCYISLLLAGVYGLTRVVQTGGFAWAALAGAFIGLGAVMRSTGLLLPVVLLPVAWASASGNSSRRVAITSAFLLTAATALMPTTIRNYRVLGHFVPVRTGGGASLLEALGPWADGGPGMNRIVYPPMPDDADEFTRDRECRRAAIAWAGAHPRETLALAMNKLSRTWSLTMNAPGFSSSYYNAISALSVGPELLLSLAGIVILRRRPAVVALLLAPAIYFTVVHMVFVGSVRYRSPAMPLLFILASAAFDRLLPSRTSASS